jgi:alkanesulfonate monooxygenase
MVAIGDCGLVIEPQQGMRFQEIIDWCAYAERNGYGYFFRSDHLLPTNGNRNRDSPECWVTLGALAATTKRIKFGPMVTPIGFRNPALLAQMACNLHAFSKGRLLLGVGAGWDKEEYLAKGYPFPKLQVRHEQLIEALTIIRPLIEGKRADFHGQHYTANTVAYPYTRSKMRLMLGGQSAFMIRAVATFADEWNLWIPEPNGSDGTPEAFQAIRQQVSKTGRKIEISRTGPFFLAKTTDQLQRKLKAKSSLVTTWGLPTSVDELRKGGQWKVLCGTVDEFRSQLNELRKAGVDKFYFDIIDPKDKEMIDLLTSTLK